MAEAPRWRITVSKLGDPDSGRTLEVGATHWVAALRAARVQLGEEDAVPYGASCAVNPEGIVTVLVPSSRRRFVLARTLPEPISRVSGDNKRMTLPPIVAPPPNSGRTQTGAPPDASAIVSGSNSPDTAEPPPKRRIPQPEPREHTSAKTDTRMPRETPRHRRKRAETATYSTTSDQRSPSRHADTSENGLAQLGVSGSSDQAQEENPHGGSATLVPPGQAHAHPAPETAALRLITERNEDPSSDNPLTYRERAYAIAPGTTLSEAETALRRSLAELEAKLAHVSRGKFVNLAVFDHSWSDVPKRAPLIVLEWRDWRGESVKYPSLELERGSQYDEQEEAERLAELFEALQDLHQCRSANAALELALELLGIAIPNEASGACLYDINTDELRFVAARGREATAQRGFTVPLGGGLVGEVALRDGATAISYQYPDETESTFDAAYDARPGMAVRTLVLRPVRRDGQLLGVLQLINRQGNERAFTRGDLNLVNYVGTRLDHTLTVLRAAPPASSSR